MGHTSGMKVAVSIPDRTFSKADALAKRLQTSRSALYARALQAFIETHEEDSVTVAMNTVIAEVGTELDEWTRAASRSVLARTEW
ncbi:hypothetical protein [Sphingomonas bacterium]|uniref:hypothetical protein n=1 Tax=Sphingomonas bacterium TaxID=1895847 RepID=UPI00157543DD|nr:hypothetical protein [Sphingomonas bacterium]